MSEELNLQATGNRLIVKVETGMKETEGGILDPNGDKPDRGIIVSIGHEVNDPAIEVGKMAVFNQYSGKDYKEGQTNYVLLNAAEIYGTRNI